MFATMKKLLIIVALASTVAASAQLRSGINMNDLNKSVRPADDFYEYACGGWMKANPLPAAYSRFGSFDRLGEDNNKRINGILKELLENSYEKGSVEQKLSDLYKLAMDSARREQEGLTPVMPLIKKMEAAKTKDQLFDVQLEMMPTGESQLFGAYIGADEKNAGENILNIYQGGLTLGQKDYYVENDKNTVKIREAYKKHIVRMFQLFGFKKGAAEKKMKNIMKVETELAKASKSRT
jgi:putative endopeptidase